MKHARPDYDRIQDPSGKIPADEPVFLLRGQDYAAGDTVRRWAYLSDLNGADPKIIELARSHAAEMDAWAAEHGKVPDLNQPPEGYDAEKVANDLVEARYVETAHLAYWIEHDNPARNLPQGADWSGARVLIFGRGEVGVAAAFQPQPANFDVAMLVLEPGLGTAQVGDIVPARPATSAFYPVAGSVALIFENAESVDVVMDRLQDIKDAFAERAAVAPADQAISEPVADDQPADLTTAAREMVVWFDDCAELFGNLATDPGATSCIADLRRALENDTQRGVYEKYIVTPDPFGDPDKAQVERTDGDPQGKHQDCQYFVLDLNHDPFAWPGLLAYLRATEAAGQHPQLVSDLREIIRRHSDLHEGDPCLRCGKREWECIEEGNRKKD